ncbi:MAG: two-component system LytT family response regulator [Bacteroidia bacterium]|jgi:two-component system LytT family response regulator
MITGLILDDEKKGSNALKKLVDSYCPEVKLVGIVSSGEQAKELIEELKPSLLFFDIEISQPASVFNTSFDLLKVLPNYNFEIIFVTAYDHYALEAIKAHAIGYVLKPVSISDLIETVKSAIPKIEANNLNHRASALISHLENENKPLDRIWIHSYKDVVPISTNEIIRFEAQGKYTDIYCKDNRTITSSKNLGEFVEMLKHNQFVKVHRSHFINSSQILKFSKSDGGSVTTTDKKELPVSRQGKERLFQIL